MKRYIWHAKDYLIALGTSLLVQAPNIQAGEFTEFVAEYKMDDGHVGKFYEVIDTDGNFYNCHMKL